MPPGLAQFLSDVLLIVGALFPIVNPLSNAPLFLALTSEYSSDVRTVLSGKIAMNGFVLMVVSILVGTNILAFFGISLPVVQVGGGMVLIAGAWSLLNKRDDEDTKHGAITVNASAVSRRAFYPLTLPLTVGPGSISVAITVGANAPMHGQAHWAYMASAIVGSTLIAISIYLSYRFAESLARVLGDTAMNVIMRLSSFILLCIGVQIAWNGVRALLNSL